MTTTNHARARIAVMILTLPFLTAARGDQTPEYAAKVPDSLLTPDVVETELLGRLEFFDGLPHENTVAKIYDFLDVTRGAQTFLNGMPAASVHAALEGLEEAGVRPGELGLFEQLMDARSLFLTANSTTMYGWFEINVKDGPLVVEYPAAVLGVVDDAFFRYVTDVGLTGPDQGRGGRYLFVHRDYEGELPGAHHVVRTPTYRNLCFFRAFPRDGDLEGAADGVKSQFRTYPMAEAENPPATEIHNLSGAHINTVHSNDFSFFEELDDVVQYEPADAFDPEIVGLFASIGIKKGRPFAPDERMKRLLTEAAAIGNASARAISTRPRKKSVYFYEDRQWNSPFAGMSHEFFNHGERVLDDRTFFHYWATGITPAMAAARVGQGSVYGFTVTDSEARYLDGGRTYKVHMPHPVPAERFWSFTVYSTQHRSMLETDQKLAGLDSNNPAVKPDPDGSYTVWFGPEAPSGHEDNWIQTVPGKAYAVLVRLYGPREPWFDKSWKPGDLELID